MLWSSEIIESTDVISVILLPQTGRFFLLFSLIMSLRTLWSHFRNELIFYCIFYTALFPFLFFIFRLWYTLQIWSFFIFHMRFIRFESFNIYSSYSSYRIFHIRLRKIRFLYSPIFCPVCALLTHSDFSASVRKILIWSTSDWPLSRFKYSNVYMKCKEFIVRCTHTKIFRILR